MLNQSTNQPILSLVLTPSAFCLCSGVRCGFEPVLVFHENSVAMIESVLHVASSSSSCAHFIA